MTTAGLVLLIAAILATAPLVRHHRLRNRDPAESRLKVAVSGLSDASWDYSGTGIRDLDDAGFNPIYESETSVTSGGASAYSVIYDDAIGLAAVPSENKVGYAQSTRLSTNWGSRDLSGGRTKLGQLEGDQARAIYAKASMTGQPSGGTGKPTPPPPIGNMARPPPPPPLPPLPPSLSSARALVWSTGCRQHMQTTNRRPNPAPGGVPMGGDLLAAISMNIKGSLKPVSPILSGNEASGHTYTRVDEKTKRRSGERRRGGETKPEGKPENCYELVSGEVALAVKVRPPRYIPPSPEGPLPDMALDLAEVIAGDATRPETDPEKIDARKVCGHEYRRIMRLIVTMDSSDEDGEAT